MFQKKRYSIVLLILLLSITTAGYAAGFPKPEVINVKRLNDSDITAYILHPDLVAEDEKVGLLVWAQGSSCDSITAVMPWLYGVVNATGNTKVAILLAEKAGVQRDDDGANCTDVFDQHNTIPQRVFDYSHLLQHLRTNATWWNHRLYIVGVSQGGAEAAVLAAFTPESQKVAILVSGGGWTLTEIKLLHKERDMRQKGRSESEIRKELNKMKEQFNEMKASSSQDLYHIRALNLLVDVTIPIYMLAGTADINDAVESSDKTVEIFKNLGKSNLIYHRYEGLDHSMTNREGISFKDEKFKDSIMWLLMD